MSDPDSSFTDEIIVAELVPEPEEKPAGPRRRRVMLPLTMFLLTCVTTFVAGGASEATDAASFILAGFAYALPVMTILICHEAGHFIQARRYGVPASFPYFIPMPIGPLGTLGAVIGMDARIGDRKALFDIGITGPLAGLVPTLIFCVLGLMRSHAIEGIPIDSDQPVLGTSILFSQLTQMLVEPLPEGQYINLHPMAVAGWVGLLLTSLNLIPIGQLDGGHILYGLLRRRAHRVATLLLTAAVVAVVFLGFWWWWLMLLLLMMMGAKHPPTANDNVPLGWPRHLLGWLTLALVPLGFSPMPLMPPPEPKKPPVFAQECVEDIDRVLIPQRLQRGGDPAAKMDEPLAGTGVADFHDGHGAEQTAEIDYVAGFRAGYGYESRGGRLVVDNADGHFVGDDRGDRLGRRVARYGDHVEPDRTDGGHRFELFQHQMPFPDRLGQGGILTDGNESAA